MFFKKKKLRKIIHKSCLFSSLERKESLEINKRPSSISFMANFRLLSIEYRSMQCIFKSYNNVDWPFQKKAHIRNMKAL